MAVGLALVEATNQTALIAGLINGATVLSVSLSWAAVRCSPSATRACTPRRAASIDGGPPVVVGIFRG